MLCVYKNTPVVFDTNYACIKTAGVTEDIIANIHIGKALNTNDEFNGTVSKSIIANLIRECNLFIWNNFNLEMRPESL